MMNKQNLPLILILIFSLIIRVWGLNKVPVSLFGDELDMGYHAYSLLKTGLDYSGNFLPIHLQSLADYKSPFFAYTIIPFVAVFGISPLGIRLPAALIGVLSILILYFLTRLLSGNKAIALIAATLLAITPWHIQYSRIGFEMLEMLTLYMMGLYFFFKGVHLKNKALLVLSSLCFAITPWVYHSAKIFLPITLILMTTLWWNEIKRYSVKILLLILVVIFIMVSPIAYDSIFGSGISRFKATNIFNDPTTIPQMGYERLRDARMRDYKAPLGVKPELADRLFHNQITIWGTRLINNYFQALSPEFLFIKGDGNPRHSIPGFGEFYIVQAGLLLLGTIFLITKNLNIKIKIFLILWILLSPLPSITTDNGGNHASRLLFLLPPLIIIMSLGFYYPIQILTGLRKKIYLLLVIGSLLLSFIFYQHTYWIHYPWDTQKWWNAGYEDAVKTAVSLQDSYDRIVISSADEPSLIYFLAWSQYPSVLFQKNKSFVTEELPGLGKAGKLDKFYFTPVGQGYDLYTLAGILPPKTLYLAPFSEIKFDLGLEPQRIPAGLKLVKIIPYPSHNSAFYLFSKND